MSTNYLWSTLSLEHFIADLAVIHCASAPSTRNMTIKRIDSIIEKLDFKEVEVALLSSESADDDPGFKVCDASFKDWQRCVETEDQTHVSRAMAFEDDKL
ncbi:hypothetical protein FI667_g5690, partial [Globisporangium splendens]